VSETAPIEVLFEDNHLLVVNKPAGLLTQSAEAGDDNLVGRMRVYITERYNKPGRVYLGLVHRLDRNVSGVVVLARTSKAAGRLGKAFAERRVAKHYLAVVEGEAQEAATLEHRLGPRATGRGVCEQPGGKEALLRYIRLGCNGTRSWLEVRLETGRKHQIRAQLALAGLPLVGDPLYGQGTSAIRRPALHGWWLALDHPVGDRGALTFVAPVPADLTDLVGGQGWTIPDRPRLT
jgi:23S rRNA pseudouridine1911/1915/1917 synthase